MESEAIGAFGSFIPLIVISLAIVSFAWPMSKRKGMGAGIALLSLVPIIGYLVLIWIASKPDKDLLDRIAKLERGA